MHWNNRNLFLYFYILKKIESLILVRFSVLERKGLLRKALKLYFSIRNAKTWVPISVTHNTRFPHRKLECLTGLTGSGRSQVGMSSSGPPHICILCWHHTECIGITQGTVYSVVLMTIGALPPCGAFRFSQQGLGTQGPPILFCFFAPSINIPGT